MTIACYKDSNIVKVYKRNGDILSFLQFRHHISKILVEHAEGL